MDSNSKRRMQWRQEEMERRRTDRARQRSEIMSQRKQAAQTMYMDRMAQRAEAGGASSGAVSAIRYGEGLGANQDRMQGYMTAKSQRGLVDAQAGKATAEGNKLQAEAANIPAQLSFEQGKFDKTYALDLRKQQAAESAQRFSQDNFTKPGIYTTPQGDKFSVGGATPMYVPQQIGDDGVVMGPDGRMIVGNPAPLPPKAPDPFRVGDSLVDHTGKELYRAPSDAEEFDLFARGDFQRSPAFSSLQANGASNDEIEKAYREWVKDEYPSD